MSSNTQQKKWLMPIFDKDDDANSPIKKQKIEKTRGSKESMPKKISENKNDKILLNKNEKTSVIITNHHNWMKNFDPITENDLAVHHKKIQEVDAWLQVVNNEDKNNMLLLTGPVGCGKTVTLKILATKYKMKLTEWITPIDIDIIPSENGEFQFREKQSKQFLDFILKAANFTSLLDSNSNKLILVEDFPNTFIRSPMEFTDVLQQYKARAKSPIVFICSESNSNNKDTALNLFTPKIKEEFQIHHISFNGVAATGLKSALKRVAEIMSKKHNALYTTPTLEMIECVVNSSGGDVRSAVTNLHFACLKGSSHSLETSIVVDKENKSKTSRKKKQASSKFLSLGKDQTVSILHGVGRVLNPKYSAETKALTHSPTEIIEQFLSQPSSFVNFIGENYLSHFSCIEHVEKAASALSDSDYMLQEWREKLCQELGLYVSVAGVMTSNKAPVSAWNPVRGPKNMKVQYPSPESIPLLDENYLYKGKVLVTDYQTFCKIIGTKT